MADFYNIASLVLLFFFLPFFLFNVFISFIHHFCAESLEGKVVLVTGASSGIGEQLAYAYGKRGALLVLVARREAALRQVAETARRMGSPDVLVAPADISNPEECRQVVEKAVTRFGKCGIGSISCSKWRGLCRGHCEERLSGREDVDLALLVPPSLFDKIPMS